jgi:hydroxymethylpyrimidine/phosphomethylpyrimidine kinase
VGILLAFAELPLRHFQTMQTVLTIAGFDPSSGAGVTADLMVFAAHGLFGTSCITALTVQSTVGVKATHAVAAEIVCATLDCLEDDLPAMGVKIGMLATEGNVAAVADFLERAGMQERRVPVVLDPVLRSSSGRELLDAAGVALLRERLLPLVDWVTPNVAELAVLTGREVAKRGDVEGAALALSGYGLGLNVLATGGHLDPPDDLVLTSDGTMEWLGGERIVSSATHGTGCALSSALLSRLVLGDEALAAAAAAKEYVAGAIRSAKPMGRGNGPLNHLWNAR